MAKTLKQTLIKESDLLKNSIFSKISGFGQSFINY